MCKQESRCYIPGHAFLSERSLFSIDLFIADASTGKVVHKLTSTATDPGRDQICAPCKSTSRSKRIR